MASLAAVDLISRRRVWPAVDLGHARLGAVVVGLLAIAGLGIATEDLPALGWVGSETVFIAISYVGAIAWVHRSSKGRLVPGTAPLYEPTPVAPGRLATLPGVLGRFLAAAAVIALAAPFVVGATERFAGAAGLGHAFAGAAMLATASALPELVVSVAAVRLGAANLAVGNLLGSAAFNMALLAPLDAVFTGGPLLAAASSAHLVTAFVAMFMVAVSQAGIVHGTETRIRRAEPDALLVLAAYAVGLALLARAA